jgi:hypothetical protein
VEVNWREFKAAVEAAGVKDQDEVKIGAISGPHNWRVSGMKVSNVLGKPRSEADRLTREWTISPTFEDTYNPAAWDVGR